MPSRTEKHRYKARTGSIVTHLDNGHAVTNRKHRYKAPWVLLDVSREVLHCLGPRACVHEVVCVYYVTSTIICLPRSKSLMINDSTRFTPLSSLCCLTPLSPLSFCTPPNLFHTPGHGQREKTERGAEGGESTDRDRASERARARAQRKTGVQTSETLTSPVYRHQRGRRESGGRASTTGCCPPLSCTV